MLHARECLVKYAAANVITQLQSFVGLQVSGTGNKLGMLSRTLKLATCPTDYLIGYLKKRLIYVLGALDPILFFILDWLPPILVQFCLQKRSQLVEKSMQDS